jgi:hypothetical protein
MYFIFYWGMKSENGDWKSEEKVILSVPSILCLNNDSLSQYKNIRIGEIFISLKKDGMETRISSFLSELIGTHNPSLPLPYDMRESLNKFIFRYIFSIFDKSFHFILFTLFYFFFFNFNLLFLFISKLFSCVFILYALVFSYILFYCVSLLWYTYFFLFFFFLFYLYIPIFQHYANTESCTESIFCVDDIYYVIRSNLVNKHYSN